MKKKTKYGPTAVPLPLVGRVADFVGPCMLDVLRLRGAIGLPFDFAVGTAAAGLGFGLGAGAGSSTLETRWRNIPWSGSQSKYRLPWTEPSFFPEASSSSTPIQSPSRNRVSPTNRTVAMRPSPSSTMAPGFTLGSMTL